MRFSLQTFMTRFKLDDAIAEVVEKLPSRSASSISFAISSSALRVRIPAAAMDVNIFSKEGRIINRTN